MSSSICDKYNVEYMAIDKTGLGVGVYQSVQKFYPNVVGLDYNPILKQICLKSQRRDKEKTFAVRLWLDRRGRRLLFYP